MRSGLNDRCDLNSPAVVGLSPQRNSWKFSWIHLRARPTTYPEQLNLINWQLHLVLVVGDPKVCIVLLDFSHSLLCKLLGTPTTAKKIRSEQFKRVKWFYVSLTRLSAIRVYLHLRILNFQCWGIICALTNFKSGFKYYKELQSPFYFFINFTPSRFLISESCVKTIALWILEVA